MHVSNKTLPTPSATDNGEGHADWLELTALTTPQRTGSAEDLIGALRSSGTTDALVDEAIDDDATDIDAATDRGSERAQALAESALDLADERSRSVLRPQRYPFSAQGRSLRARPGAANSTYTFLLLLTRYGISAEVAPPHENGSELFEGVAAVAARNYLGGDSTHAQILRFGSPRREAPTGFVDALDEMCFKMSEGGGANRSRFTVSRQKDAKLDLAVWIPMPDTRYGKFIGFGQCATGGNWTDKVSELQPNEWCTKWLLDRPPAVPLRMFFLPHRVNQNEWVDRALDAGIIFDRCRLTAYAARLPQELRTRVHRWNTHVLREQLDA